jgi:hypothetical protein
MITDILKNIFILQLGALLRFLFYYFVKRNKQVTYHSILNGKDKGKTKADEIFNIRNEFINRLYALGFLLIIVVFIIIFQSI